MRSAASTELFTALERQLASAADALAGANVERAALQAALSERDGELEVRPLVCVWGGRCQSRAAKQSERRRADEAAAEASECAAEAAAAREAAHGLAGAGLAAAAVCNHN